MDTKAYIIAAIASIPAVLLNDTIKSFTEDKEKFKRIRNLFIKYSFFSLSVLFFLVLILDKYENLLLLKSISEEQIRFYLFLWFIGILVLFLNKIIYENIIKKIVDVLKDLLRHEFKNKNNRLTRLILRYKDEIIKISINFALGFLALNLLSYISPLHRVTEFKNLTKASVVDINKNIILHNISIPENTKFEFIYQEISEKNNPHNSKVNILMSDSVLILEQNSIISLEKGTEIILTPKEKVFLQREGKEIVDSLILTSDYSKGQLSDNINVKITEDSEINLIFRKNVLYYVLFEIVLISYSLAYFYFFKIIFKKTLTNTL